LPCDPPDLVCEDHSTTPGAREEFEECGFPYSWWICPTTESGPFVENPHKIILTAGKWYPNKMCAGDCNGGGEKCVTKATNTNFFVTPDGEYVFTGHFWWSVRDAEGSLDGKITEPGLYWVDGKITWVNLDEYYSEYPAVREKYYIEGHVTPMCGLLE
jgi:hypothetical protein